MKKTPSSAVEAISGPESSKNKLIEDRVLFSPAATMSSRRARHDAARRRRLTAAPAEIRGITKPVMKCAYRALETTQHAALRFLRPDPCLPTYQPAHPPTRIPLLTYADAPPPSPRVEYLITGAPSRLWPAPSSTTRCICFAPRISLLAGPRVLRESLGTSLSSFDVHSTCSGFTCREHAVVIFKKSILMFSLDAARSGPCMDVRGLIFIPYSSGPLFFLAASPRDSSNTDCTTEKHD